MQFYATAVKNHRASIELFEKLGSWGDDPESTSKKELIVIPSGIFPGWLVLLWSILQLLFAGLFGAN